MRKYLYTILLCLAAFSLSATATEVAQANAAYRVEDYHKAVALYQQSLKRGVSVEAYYNLGNAYYRIGNVPKALLYYEKALKMSPLDDDILHNIDMARSKTIDKLPAESSLFFVQWYDYLQSLVTVDAWGSMALVSLVSALLLFLVYLFAVSLPLRRISFYTSALLSFLFVIGNLFAWQRKAALTTHDTGIVMTVEAPVKQSPTLKSPDAFVIHEGTKVRITDHDMRDWLGIRLSDGREGWIQSKDVEEI